LGTTGGGRVLTRPLGALEGGPADVDT